MPVMKYDVIATDSESAKYFIRHVGLAAAANLDAKSDSVFFMTHMAPPFFTSDREVQISGMGTALLSQDEAKLIKLFIEEVDSEYKAANLRNSSIQYCACPHTREYHNKRTGVLICIQYTCAGIVLEAYKAAIIDIIETDPKYLPRVGLNMLLLQYPDQAESLKNPKLRDRLGIGGQGPWPVVLPGYILNALNRSPEQIRSIRYKAQSGDEFFPAQSGLQGEVKSQPLVNA